MGLTTLMIVYEVPCTDVAFWEPVIREQLEKMERKFPDRVDIPDVLNRLREEKLHVWLFEEERTIHGLATVEVVDRTPERRELHFEHVAGDDLETWVDLLRETALRAARSINATHIRAIGRRGWKKWAERLGLKETMVVWEVPCG